MWLPWESAVTTYTLFSQTLKIGNYRKPEQNVYLDWAV